MAIKKCNFFTYNLLVIWVELIITKKRKKLSRRMIAFLCKANKHQTFMRDFIYDIILEWRKRKSIPLFIKNFVFHCVRIWPEPFNWPRDVISIATSSNIFSFNCVSESEETLELGIETMNPVDEENFRCYIQQRMVKFYLFMILVVFRNWLHIYTFFEKIYTTYKKKLYLFFSIVFSWKLCKIVVF